MPDSFDLLVVGAGVIGLSVAWRAAQRGLAVCVVERERPGVGASTAAAGLLGPSEPHAWTGPLGAATRAALEAWEDFALELERAADGPVGLRRDGALHIATDTAGVAALYKQVHGDAPSHVIEDWIVRTAVPEVVQGGGEGGTPNRLLYTGGL